MILLGALLAAAIMTAPTMPDWHDQLRWRGSQASMTAGSDGHYVLHAASSQRAIPSAAWRTHTASILFDGLFAMAQDDLHKDSVTSIKDDAFDHGQPMPCHCFETGAKWHYVWTRDLSYAVDLGLWRFDPSRARNGLLFKLSDVRAKNVAQGPASRRLYPMQDTGSGGSWPISTDRIVWFLGARHLLDDSAFSRQTGQALNDTLAQDRHYIFDPTMGLYRGETSFLDWREQSYPEWTANNVSFIAQSFALSTNVLHFEALRLAAQMAKQHHDARAAEYRRQAATLKVAINAHFWRNDRQLYMSYIGGNGMPIEAYDLLGVSLAITSGVADAKRARETLAHYPTWPAGSPVIWPERAGQPIYHNRAIWPFVSAYALRAARAINDPSRIEHQLRSLMRGAALSGSNMENFDLTTQSTHVDDGKLSGPVVDSKRQLWSVAGYLDMVTEGVFGLMPDNRIEPKLPVSLVPMLFGNLNQISLQLPLRHITLIRPARLDGNLLVADTTQQHGDDTIVTLKAIDVTGTPLQLHAPMYAPPTPDAPDVVRDGRQWKIRSVRGNRLYINGMAHGTMNGPQLIAAMPTQQCFSVTTRATDGLESLPSPAVCVGDDMQLAGSWPRHWHAPASDHFQVALRYLNKHGPINTGITAAVKQLRVECAGQSTQILPLALPHSLGWQLSTTGHFDAKAGAHCSFTLQDGFNMSYLSHFAHYTGGNGGSTGPLNQADIGALLITPLATGTPAP